MAKLLTRLVLAGEIAQGIHNSNKSITKEHPRNPELQQSNTNEHPRNPELKQKYNKRAPRKSGTPTKGLRTRTQGIHNSSKKNYKGAPKESRPPTKLLQRSTRGMQNSSKSITHDHPRNPDFQ